MPLSTGELLQSNVSPSSNTIIEHPSENSLAGFIRSYLFFIIYGTLAYCLLQVLTLIMKTQYRKHRKGIKNKVKVFFKLIYVRNKELFRSYFPCCEKQKKKRFGIDCKLTLQNTRLNEGRSYSAPTSPRSSEDEEFKEKRSSFSKKERLPEQRVRFAEKPEFLRG